MKASETNVLQLLQGSKVFLIPNFQRRYSWRSKQWGILWADLLREHSLDHTKDRGDSGGHFLGSIVLHPASGTASVLAQHLVVDGQQRLTTILILLAAIRDVRRETDPTWDGSEYDIKYLTNPFDAEFPDRLRPSTLDRAAYTSTLRHGAPRDGIGQAYLYFRDKLQEAISAEDIDPRSLGDTLLLHMLLVEINTDVGDSVNNIFNTLNSKGLPLSPSDLVRNELLLHVGDQLADQAFEEYWIPIEQAFTRETTGAVNDREFTTFLWSREVVHQPNTTRLDLFSFFEQRLRVSFRGLKERETRLQALAEFESIRLDAQLFTAIREPNNQSPFLRPGSILHLALVRLREWNSEPATPIALWVLREHVAGRISEQEAADTVTLLIGYLVRRTLAGIPTNLLNRLLTPLAHSLQVAETQPTQTLRTELSQRGMYWPRDSEVLSSIETQPLFASARRQTTFLLTEAERAFGDPHFSADSLRVERILPEELSDDWREQIKASGEELDEALALINTLGNLCLRSSIAPAEATFEARLAGLEPLAIDHALITARGFDPAILRSRSVQLAKALLNRYPGPDFPDRTPADVTPSQSKRLAFALQSLPSGSWTTASALSMHSAVPLERVRTVINHLEPAIARLVRDEEGNIPTWFSTELLKALKSQTTSIDVESFASADRISRMVEEAEESVGGDALD